MFNATPICFWLLVHLACCAFRLALARAGSSIAARIAMMAITTSNFDQREGGPVRLCVFNAIWRQIIAVSQGY